MPRNVLLSEENDVIFICKQCGRITPNNNAILECFCSEDCRDEYNARFDEYDEEEDDEPDEEWT